MCVKNVDFSVTIVDAFTFYADEYLNANKSTVRDVNCVINVFLAKNFHYASSFRRNNEIIKK